MMVLGMIPAVLFVTTGFGTQIVPMAIFATLTTGAIWAGM